MHGGVALLQETTAAVEPGPLTLEINIRTILANEQLLLFHEHFIELHNIHWIFLFFSGQHTYTFETAVSPVSPGVLDSQAAERR